MSKNSRDKENNLKLSLDLSSDTDSEFKQKGNKVLKKIVESPKIKKINSDSEDDFSLEISGRKNKAVITNNKKTRTLSISSTDMSTEIDVRKSQSESPKSRPALKNTNNDELSRTASSLSRSRSSSYTKSRDSSLKPDKKKVSFTKSNTSISCSSSNSDDSSSDSQTPRSSIRATNNNKEVVERKSRERKKEGITNTILQTIVKNEVNKSEESSMKELQKPKKERSESPTVSSLTSSLDETLLPMRVFINDQKPPIDKTNLKAKPHRRSPSLEKPSDTETVNVNSDRKKDKEKTKKKDKNQRNDDEESGSESIFDVSPLPSPYQPKVTITQKSVTPTIDQNEKLKIMKFNEIFDMRELMRSIDDKIEKFTQQGTNRSQRSSPNPNRNHHYHSNENLSAKSDKRTSSIHKSFLSNSHFLGSDSDLFNSRNLESRNTNTAMVVKKKKNVKSKPAAEKLVRVTSSALNRIVSIKLFVRKFLRVLENLDINLSIFVPHTFFVKIIFYFFNILERTTEN